MLEGLRTASQKWMGRLVMSVVMGFISLSFVIWGINDMFRGYGGSRLAEVGNTPISVEAFRATYQQELSSLQRQLQRPISTEQARQFGLDSSVLGKLLAEAALDQRTHSLGMAISDDEIAKAIKDDPTFKGVTGQFDKNQFDALVRNAGLSERGFIQEQRKLYLREQLLQSLAGGIAAPQAMREAFHQLADEIRKVDVIVLPSASVGDIAPPDPAELQKYFETHKAAFRAPEYRDLVLVSATPSSLAQPDTVSDADAMKRYEQVKASRFGTPEKRQLRQMVFPSESEAAAASDRIKAGTSFDAIAAERHLAGVDLELGIKSKAEIFDKPIAEAAFTLPEGAVSEPVKGAFGPTLIAVDKVIPASFKPFADVAADLKRAIAQDRAKDSVRSVHDKIEEQRTAGKPLAEAAKAAGLEVRLIEAVDASGRARDGKDPIDIPERDALLKAAFAADIGTDNDTILTKDNGFVWYEVAKIYPAHDRPLSEVTAEVEQIWRGEETARRLQAKAAELVKQINAGSKFADIAAAQGNLEIRRIDAVKRSGAAGLPATGLPQVFSTGVGGAGTIRDDTGGVILFQVVDSTLGPLNPEQPEAQRLAQALDNALTRDVRAQYVERLQKDLGVSINQPVLEQIIGGNANGVN
jgi:peptidyl-prolyl cis-trans isomerase D